MKKLLFLLSIVMLCSCSQKKQEDYKEIELTYRGIHVGVESAKANLDSILSDKIVLENVEFLSHIPQDGLDGKNIVAQFIDSIIIDQDNIISGIVSVYSYRDKISDVVFSTQRTDFSNVILPLINLYEEKYGPGEYIEAPFKAEYYSTRAKEWKFKHNSIEFFEIHYNGPSIGEYSGIASQARELDRTEIIYRDSYLNKECEKAQEVIEKFKNDSIQHIQDSISQEFEKKKQIQDI